MVAWCAQDVGAHARRSRAPGIPPEELEDEDLEAVAELGIPTGALPTKTAAGAGSDD
jgi:hypothetical protein